jgi:hypothetical protein
MIINADCHISPFAEGIQVDELTSRIKINKYDNNN